MKHQYDLSRDKWLHDRSQKMAELGKIVFERRIEDVEHWSEVSIPPMPLQALGGSANDFEKPADKEAQRVSRILFKAKLAGTPIEHPYRLIKRGLENLVLQTSIYRGAVSLCS